MLVYRMVMPLCLAVAVSSCSSLRLKDISFSDSTSWSTAYGSNQRTSVANTEPDRELSQVWNYNSGGAFGPGSPILVDGNLIVGTRKGEVHVVNINSGKREAMDGLGDAINGGLAISSTGTLIVPISSRKGRGIKAINLRTGDTIWRHRGTPVDLALTIVDESVLYASTDGVVTSANITNGEVEWEVEIDGGFRSDPVESNGRFVIANKFGVITAIDVNDGRIVWSTDIGQPVYSSLATDGNRVYAGTTRGSAVAIELSNGDLAWTEVLGNRDVRLTGPAVANGTVVFGASNGRVFSISADGDLGWSENLSEAINGVPLLTPASVFVGVMDRRVVRLDRGTGEIIWADTLKGRVKSAMIAVDNKVVALAEPRNIYCFGYIGGDE